MPEQRDMPRTEENAERTGRHGLPGAPSVEKATCRSSGYCRDFRVAARAGLNLRQGPGNGTPLVTTLKNGTSVHCGGWYAGSGEQTWLLVSVNGVQGYADRRFLRQEAGSGSGA